MTITFNDLYTNTQNTLIQMGADAPECLANLSDQELESLLTKGGLKGVRFAAYLDCCREAYGSAPQEIPNADETLPKYAFSDFTPEEMNRLGAEVGENITPRTFLGNLRTLGQNTQNGPRKTTTMSRHLWGATEQLRQYQSVRHYVYFTD